MIKNREVYGAPELVIEKDLSFGKHVIDKLREHGDQIALINGITEEEISYRSLLDKIARIGIGLKRLKIGPGDVVAVCSENCSEHITVTVAAAALGAVTTHVNIKYTTDEMAHVLNISKPKLILCSEAVLETKLKALLQMPWLSYIVQVSGRVRSPEVQPLATLEPSHCDLEQFQPQRTCAADETAFIFYSSGTTGLPKGVMLTHQAVLYGTTVFNYEEKSKSNILCVLPWNHVYGLLSTIQYLVNGNLVVYLSGAALDPTLFLATVQKYQITEMVAVPTIICMLSTPSLVGEYDLSSLRKIWFGGAPLSTDIIERAQKHLPNCKMIQCYGMTETSLCVLKEQDETATRGSCGVPAPGVIAKIVDAVSRQKLGPNEQGELCLRGPSIFKGYVDNEEATRDIFDEEGFIKTGDVGYYDDNGRFYIVDRLKELIKYKGHQVAPALVESVILQHEGVAECGVVGLPDELAGELPLAFVLPKPGTSLTERDILDFTSPKLSSICRLRGGVIIVDAIPKNASGKILRRELRNKLKKTK